MAVVAVLLSNRLYVANVGELPPVPGRGRGVGEVGHRLPVSSGRSASQTQDPRVLRPWRVSRYATGRLRPGPGPSPRPGRWKYLLRGGPRPPSPLCPELAWGLGKLRPLSGLPQRLPLVLEVAWLWKTHVASSEGQQDRLRGAGG